MCLLVWWLLFQNGSTHNHYARHSTALRFVICLPLFSGMLLRLKAEGMVPQLHEGATEVAQPVARPAIPSGKSTYYTDVASDSTDAADDDDSSLTPSA